MTESQKPKTNNPLFKLNSKFKREIIGWEQINKRPNKKVLPEHHFHTYNINHKNTRSCNNWTKKTNKQKRSKLYPNRIILDIFPTLQQQINQDHKWATELHVKLSRFSAKMRSFIKESEFGEQNNRSHPQNNHFHNTTSNQNKTNKK